MVESNSLSAICNTRLWANIGVYLFFPGHSGVSNLSNRQQDTTRRQIFKNIYIKAK